MNLKRPFAPRSSRSAREGKGKAFLSSRRARLRGTVAIEFVICLLPTLVAFFGIAQLALVASARLVVQYAASRAVRAAVVILDDEPSEYGGAMRGDLTSGDGSLSWRSYLHLLPGIDGPIDSADLEGGSRLSAVRMAAYLPLAVLAPALDTWLGSLQLARASSTSLLQVAGGLAVYGRAAASITLRDQPGSDKVVQAVEPDALVTVHVAFLFPCEVPVGSKIVCKSAAQLLGIDATGEELRKAREALGRNDLSSVDAAWKHLAKARQRFEQGVGVAHTLSYAELPALQALLLFSERRFVMIEAEASLPNQGASYHEDER